MEDHHIVQRWKRIYLEEGLEGLQIKRRGRGSKGRPPQDRQKGRGGSVGGSSTVTSRGSLPKKLASLGFGRRATPAQKTQVIQKLRPTFPLTLLLSIAQIPRATYYYHAKRQREPDKYGKAKEEIAVIYHENKGRYGYRRITEQLRKRGFTLNHKTVQRLMKEAGLVCRVRMKKYKSYKREVGKIAPDLLERDFKATAPNQKWVTDVTQFSLFGKKLYLSPILDLYSRDIVSYSISYRPVLSMVTEMLERAFEIIPDEPNLVLHSDQGWHYQHKLYQRLLKDKGIRQSMSRKGNCLDNAVIENFFGLLKSELLYLQVFQSMEHFIAELIEYLDYYNNRRIKAKLKGLPPALHRLQALVAS